MEKTVFKEGDRVFHIEYGWGEVITTEEEYAYPVIVKFDNNLQASFLESGKELPDLLQPMLSFTEYTLQGFSQERPMELPEVGEEVMVSSNGLDWLVKYFVRYNPNGDYKYIAKDPLLGGYDFGFRYLKRLR